MILLEKSKTSNSNIKVFTYEENYTDFCNLIDL